MLINNELDFKSSAISSPHQENELRSATEPLQMANIIYMETILM